MEIKLQVQVEREFIVEVIGETKVCVAVYPDKCEVKMKIGDWM